MPRLTKASVTRASRIMLPVHCLFSTGLGLAWLLQDGARTAVPALSAVRSVWPIWATGAVILCVGLISVAGLLSHKRAIAATSLGMGALTFLILAVLITLPIAHDGASFSAPLWPLYVAFAHVASMVSLAMDSPETP